MYERSMKYSEIHDKMQILLMLGEGDVFFVLLLTSELSDLVGRIRRKHFVQVSVSLHY